MQRLAYSGALNSLSQLVLKIASPGVPDFYQGAELWDLRLVDPDNRGPVEFRKRVRFLKDLKKRESKNHRHPALRTSPGLGGRTDKALRDLQGTELSPGSTGSFFWKADTFL